MIRIVFVLLVNTVCFSTVIQLSNNPLLFIDGYAIESLSNVSRTLHPAEKIASPVLVSNEYEGGKLYITNVSLDQDRGVLRMWYRGKGGTRYAESSDGVNWTRYSDSTALFPKGAGTLLIDAGEPDSAKRYKMFGSNGAYNFWGAYSADGINWQEYPGNPVIGFGSEIISTFRDAASSDYLLFVRPYVPSVIVSGNTGRRLISISTTCDFSTYTPMRTIFAPDSIDDQWVAPGSVQRTEFYSMSGFKYGSHYIGLLQVFRITEIIPLAELASGQSQYEGPIDSQLVHSRDGLSWSRFEDRSAIISLGESGGFDAGCIMNVADEPVVFDNHIYHYYTAINTTHGGHPDVKEITIGLAKWRLDGYVSIDAGDVEGVIQTPSLVLNGNALALNANAEGGYVKVEVCDGDTGTVLPGFSVAQCQSLSADSIHHIVSWDNKSVIQHEGTVKLRIKMKNAALYSIKAMEIDTPPVLNGLQCHLTADAVNLGLDGLGNYVVTQMPDISGGGNDAAGVAEIAYNGSIAGKNILKFTGTNLLRIPHKPSLNPDPSGGFTIFTVAGKTAAVTANQIWLYKGNTIWTGYEPGWSMWFWKTASDVRTACSAASAGIQDNNHRALSFIGHSSNELDVYTIVLDGQEITAYRGTDIFPSEASYKKTYQGDISNTQDIIIGCDNLNFARIIIYNRKLNTDEINSVRVYLMAKYTPEELDGCQMIWASGYGEPADLNSDCYVDIRDWSIFAQSWMTSF